MSQQDDGVLLEENIRVPMRDGVHLSVDVSRPPGDQQVPALLSMSPYGKEMQRFPPGTFSFVEAGPTSTFVRRGYAHVITDSRGSHPSEGQWALASADEQRDGYDLVEWIAAQPWCTGKVAMVGGSYYGHIQFLVAATQPPHLATIVPFNGWTDLYRDFVYHGGLLHQFFPGWAAGVYGRVLPPLGEASSEAWQPPVDVVLEALSRSPCDGPFYEERSAITRIERIQVPVYHLVSTATYNHYRGQLIAYTRISAPQKLMLMAGNLRRALYSDPISAEILRWLDYWLKGVDTGVMAEPPVTLFIQGADDWRFESEYPPARTRWTPWYLHSEGAANDPPGGSLSAEQPKSEAPDGFDYPACDRRAQAGEPVLAYLTEPFAEDVELIGPISATLYASTTATDVSWVVKIDDMAPDGSWKAVTKGWLKGSHRAVDPARSRPGQPYHPHVDPRALRPGEVEEFEIEIWPLCRRFQRGHRLRLRIATSDSRTHDAGNTHTPVEVPMRIEVHHSAQYPSHLLVPIVPSTAPVAARPSFDYLPSY